MPGLSRLERLIGETLAVEATEILYTRSGDVNIAYQVVGTGAIDLVLVPGFISHLELDWAEPRSAHFLRRLASFSRLIRFDKRGTGLSDRPGGLPDLETRMDDVRAVLDAVGSERAALLGYSEGGPMSLLFAGTYPQRTTALILYGTYAKRRDPDDDYPWAPTWEERHAYAEEIERDWGRESESDIKRMSPSADEALARWWATRARAAASPGAARDLVLMNSEIDVRALLPAIHVPTLVLHRSGDRDARPEEGRYISERIPGARFIELSGEDHLPWIDGDQILDEVEEFLTGVRRGPEPDRILATVLFTDIVGSTEKAAALGDRAWLELRDDHDALVRRELARFRGNEIDTAGDGFLASFDGPARAVRCGWAIVRGIRNLGLEVRAGVHTGECELAGGKLGGIAVHIGARVAGLAGPGEVLVSSTVKDLVAGSGIVFRDRGAKRLKGVEEEWRLFAVRERTA
jgi:class 3 adenylate cyclase